MEIVCRLFVGVGFPYNLKTCNVGELKALNNVDNANSDKSLSTFFLHVK